MTEPKVETSPALSRVVQREELTDLPSGGSRVVTAKATRVREPGPSEALTDEFAEPSLVRLVRFANQSIFVM